MSDRKCGGINISVARVLVGVMVVTTPGLQPYSVFAQSRAIRVQPTASGIRTAGYAPLSLNMTGGISAGTLTGATLKANLLSPVPGLTPKLQAAPASAAPEAAAPQAKLGGISASVQLGAAAISASRIEPQDGAALKTESARNFDGMNVKPGSGNDAVTAEAGGAAWAANGLARPAGRSAGRARGVPAPSRMQRAMAATKSYIISNKMPLLVSAGALAVAAIGQALGFNMAGDMTWGLGALPMMLMGMLGPQDDAFLDELNRSYDPGEIITAEVAAEIGQRLGVADVTSAILDKLVEEGHLMLIADGGYIYLGPEIPGSEVDASIRQALKTARQGRLDDSVAALAYFDDAVKKSPNDSMTLAQAVRDNASVMFLLKLLKENKRSIQKMAAQDPKAWSTHQATLSKLNVVIAKLETMTFSAGMSVLPTIPVSVRNVLMSNMKQFVSECLYGRNGRKALSPDADRGSDRIQEFIEDSVEPQDNEARETEPESARVPVDGSSDATSSDKVETAAPAAAAKFKAISATDRDYSNLHEFGVNLTAKAAEGKFPAFIGRESELRQMIKTLMRVEKNNPVVIGEKGVGKTAIVRGLAQRIVDGKIPQLAGKNIFQLDLAALIAGTKYRGQFEERLKGVMDEVKKSQGRVILFIDEIHNIKGAGSSEGSNDASQLLKEALSSGDISLIGATTLNEYRQKIESDGALARRFNPIILQPPTPEEAVGIVSGVKSRYEKKHGVAILAETVRAVVAMAARYIKDRNLPDSALDLIDDASAEVALKAQAAKDAGQTPVMDVTPDDVAAEISARPGIPAKQMKADDMEALRRLPDELKERVIGQDAAIAAVTRAIKRGRLGYKKAKKPLGSFLFLGPTGVGKTEVARVLSAKLFKRGEADIVRIDMSEFMDKAAVSRLTGSAPGYIGYGEGGQLTEPVRRNPYTVVLFDEVEKAAPEVLDILLQVIEDGRLTDSMGRTVDFSNTIIIMTSNIGAKQGDAAQGAEEEAATGAESAKRPLGFYAPAAEKAAAGKAAENTDSGQRVGAYMSALKAKLRPEFINRVGKSNIIVFNKLTREDLKAILGLQVAELQKRMSAKEMKVTLTPAAEAHILDYASNQENLAYGARPLADVIESQVEEALVEAELAGSIGKGDTAVVDYVKGRFVVKKAAVQP